MIMCKIYAPADTEEAPILVKKERKLKQRMSYLTLTIELALAIFINNPIVSNIIIFGIIIQTITISRIAYKLTKSKYGHEVYAN